MKSDPNDPEDDTFDEVNGQRFDRKLVALAALMCEAERRLADLGRTAQAAVLRGVREALELNEVEASVVVPVAMDCEDAADTAEGYVWSEVIRYVAGYGRTAEGDDS